MDTTDCRTINIGIGVGPAEVRWALEAAISPYYESFGRWDGITCDEAGMCILGRMTLDDAEVPLVIHVVYHYNRGSWTPYIQEELAAYLDNLGLGGYVRSTGENRFLTSTRGMVENQG